MFVVASDLSLFPFDVRLQLVREGTGDSERTVSREVQFLRIAPNGEATFAGWAPHLDLRPATEAEADQVKPLLDAA